MTPLRLTVNGAPVEGAVEPRTHLADFLRDTLNLTATHLRCEQGACGACTILMDGAPVRSCITYAVQCADVEITTLEGLTDDPVMLSLSEAFSAEHGLQCGYCTPGMLVTARDIVLRLPDADEARVRVELSGNLCRCTGYQGIVAAVARVLAERRSGTLALPQIRQRSVGPVGARATGPVSHAPARPTSSLREASKVETALGKTDELTGGPEASDLGLAGRQPNFEIRRTFVMARSPEEVWNFFGQVDRIVGCLPGAALAGPIEGERIAGRMTVKLGPIRTDFFGTARITRDPRSRRGTIAGSGRDRLSGSRAAADIDYAVRAAADGVSEIDIVVRALLSGALAQFGRSGIVDDLASRLTDAFAQNIERRLGRGADPAAEGASAPLAAGSLLWAVLTARAKSLFKRFVATLHR